MLKPLCFFQQKSRDRPFRLDGSDPTLTVCDIYCQKWTAVKPKIAGAAFTQSEDTPPEPLQPRAVWGNIDGHKLREAINEVEIFYCEGKKVLMIHIAGKPPKYNPHVRKLIYQHQPDILVCGHSHILRIEKDRRNNLLFINPGAAGIHGFHQVKTLVRFELKQGTISNMEVIELGKRGSLN